MPYTFGKRTGGAAEAKYTLRAPASRAISTISRDVVPRTMESSMSTTRRPSSRRFTGLSFSLTPKCRIDWRGSMKVRPM